MAFNLAALVPDFLKGAFDVVDQLVTDKDKAAELKYNLATQGNQLQSNILNAQRDIIVAEAKSGSWLTQNWRPITMLTFTALVVAHWLGWTAPNLSEDQVLALLEIVKIGLGGYVVGRSAEKVAKNYFESKKTKS